MTELKATINMQIDRKVSLSFATTQFLEEGDPVAVAEQCVNAGATMKLIATAFSKGFEMASETT